MLFGLYPEEFVFGGGVVVGAFAAGLCVCHCVRACVCFVGGGEVLWNPLLHVSP